MSRVYEALKNAQDQRTIRGPLEAEATPPESGVREPVHNGKAASRIPEILSAVRAEGAPPVGPLQLEQLQKLKAEATLESGVAEPIHNSKTAHGIPEIRSAVRPEVAPPVGPL